MPDNPFGEEIFPNLQYKHPLVQLEAVYSCSIACYLGKETERLAWLKDSALFLFNVKKNSLFNKEMERSI